MMRIYYWLPSTLLFLNLICLKSFAQEEIDPKKLFVEAESFFLFEEYKDALPLYQKIARIEPENYNVQYKIGICYLNDIYLSQKSIGYLERSSQNVNLKYKQNNFKEKQAPLEAYYYLGKAYHINGMLDKAIEGYTRFKSLANTEEFNFNIVDEDIQACQLAKKMLKQPIFFSPTNLHSPINTRFEEKNPVISGDGNTLIFTRSLQFYNGVFISKRNTDGTWSEPVNLTSDFGLDGNSYACGISYFGDEIFVYRSDNFDGNIYSSNRVGDKWSQLKKLNANINTKFWESHASISEDGQYLYFTSNRDGGFGGLDIYKSKRFPKGDWGPAINLGPVINSPNNEETPFLSSEGYALFFSSEGHETMGGYDVFVSILRSNGTWSKPKNMGSPLNTTGDDLFYNPMGVNSFGYMALYDKASTMGMLDIYEIEVYNEYIPRTFQVQGQLKVNEADSKFYKKLTVKILNADTKEVVDENKVKEDGEISLSASQGEYILLIEGPEIDTYQKNLSLAINQPGALVVLPEIVLDKTSDKSVTEVISSIDVIVAKNDFFAVHDSGSVAIDLIIPKGSDLLVDISLNDSVVFAESIESVRKRFTYFYKPKPGENILKFTATDPEGNISSTIVNVTYYLPRVSSKGDELKEIESELSVNATFFDMISEGPLKEYLRKIEMSDFENYSQLYLHLVKVSDQEGFSRNDVNNMFAIYFSQKDMHLFDSDFREKYSKPDSSWNAVFDTSAIPLIYLKTLLQEEMISIEETHDALLELVSDNFEDGNSLYSYLLGFKKDTTEQFSDIPEISSAVQAWEIIAEDLGDREANSVLQLASTTEDLHFFYQNLLIASSGELNEYLSKLQYESVSGENSIDLLNYLFDIVPNEKFSYEDLIEALEKASLNRQYYLNTFNEVLASNATGNLKSSLLLLNLDESQINTYEELLRYLVEKAQYKNYSTEEVYKLLLELIDIYDVNEFSEKIKSYNIASINKALADTSLKYFSNPFELLQYLLAATNNYDFTESDINNLLIRMILERGLSDQISLKKDSKGESIWKNKKFLITIILVNVVILIFIILLSLRRKKQ